MTEDTIAVPEPGTDSSTRFSVVLRGYDRHQVDEYVQALQERVARQGRSLAEAEARLESGQENDRVPQPRPPAESAAAGVGARIEKILGLAETEAAAIRAAAEREAEEIRASARTAVEGAETVRRSAEAEARREANLILTEAEDEAARVRVLHQELTEDLDRIAAGIARLRGHSRPSPRPAGRTVEPGEPENEEPVPAPRGRRRTGASATAADRELAPAADHAADDRTEAEPAQVATASDRPVTKSSTEDTKDTGSTDNTEGAAETGDGQASEAAPKPARRSTRRRTPADRRATSA